MRKYPGRFFLTRDGDGHDYLVPVAMRSTWDEWREIPTDDPRSWDVPEGAIALGGSPEGVEFNDPEVTG
jgi:hypothetical protein